MTHHFLEDKSMNRESMKPKIEDHVIILSKAKSKSIIYGNKRE